MATPATEDYLKHIMVLERGSEADARVSTGALARALGVSPGSVTAMLRQLAEQGFAKYERYAGVSLSEEGRRIATDVLRRHRLIELFLVKVVGMDWSEVHEEAERLEHHVSPRLLARLDELLGFPAEDPHGDPIPSAEGRVEEKDLLSLLAAPLGVPLVVSRVADQDPHFLQWLNKLGIQLGAQIVVETRDEAADALLLRIGDEDQVHGLGLRAASKIHVEVSP